MAAHRASFVSLAALALATLLGCAAEPATPDASFHLYASGSAPPRAPGAKSPLGSPSRLTGDPAALVIGTYALYLGASADCSDLKLVQSNGASGSVEDLMASPLLFSASPQDGSYACMAMKMSDVIHVVPTSSFGGCAAGHDYVNDIYRKDENDWVDTDYQLVEGHGDDVNPVDDGVTLFMTTDANAAILTGINMHQAIPLGAPLKVPGQTTFYWDAAGTVVDEDGACTIEPGRPSFE
jgi:hypothetical protein